MVMLRPAQVAIIALAFGRYVASPFFDLCPQSSAIDKCLAAFIISEFREEITSTFFSHAIYTFKTLDIVIG